MIVILDMIIYSALIISVIIGIKFDFKTREVPDTLNYGLIFFGFIIGAVLSIFSWSIFPILSSFLGFSVGFIIGALMYHMRQWGGGDAKILMGICSVIGFTIPLTVIPKLVIFIMFTFIGGLFYTLTWTTIILIRNIREAQIKYNELQTRNIKYVKYFILLLSIISLIAYFITGNISMISLIIALVGLYLLIYIYMISNVMQEISMKKKVTPKDLTEGDWLYEDVIVNGKVIIPKSIPGLDKDNIKLIMNLHKQKKIRYVLVKEGIPFTPAFLLGLIGLIIFKIFGY